MNKIINLSVHDLVDFLLRTGDIDNRIFNQDTMEKGNKIHAQYQLKKKNNYYSEYYLKAELKVDEFVIKLDGRADGIFLDKIPIIEEIKSTVEDLQSFSEKHHDWHIGQAICYAYMFLKERHLNKAQIRLIYISQLKDERKEKIYDFTYKQLEDKLIGYIKDYLSFYKLIYEHKLKRNISIKEAPFPFKKLRKGQADFIKTAYKIANNGGVAFAEAPTGIGKTIASIFPALKAFNNEDNEKIFYLTAKNTGKVAALNTLTMLTNKGVDIKAISLLAKEKMCLKGGASCNPIECPFAKDYYTHLKKALIDAFINTNINDETGLKTIGEKYQICPFEFSLDLSLYVDVIVADYNYFFDPIVHLQRYFDGDNSNHIILIDEAHNLLERARDMYSENLSYMSFLSLKSDYQNINKGISRAINRVDKEFKNLFKITNIHETKINDIEHSFYLSLHNLREKINDFLSKEDFHPSQNSIDFSIKLNRFLKLYENRQDSDAIYIDKKENNIILHLFCLDPCLRVRSSLESVKGVLLFSATLSPFNYYLDSLGGKKEDEQIALSSPFSSTNFKLIIASASLLYKNRDKSLSSVVDYVKYFTSFKEGHYLVYVPSFEYLEKIRPYFQKDNNVIFQDKTMNEIEKQLFISNFKNNNIKHLIGFVVLGGVFNESIDLVADSLIGVAVIGVGLPTISFRQNLIKEYFENNNEGKNGFNYAYKYPGFNKVSQAVGRLIRSEKDVGVALLIDDRYFTNSYRDLFNNSWKNYDTITNPKEIDDKLKKFWNK